MEYCGAKLTTDISIVKKSVDTAGFGYLHAPLFNPAMKNVAPIRKALGVRTFFNVLGPLISPARPTYQMLGVYNLKMMRLYNYINQKLGNEYMLVHSLDGYDEISLTSDTKIMTRYGDVLLSPEMMGMKTLKQSDLFVGESIKDAADIFMAVLENRSTSAQKDVVTINAALAIRTICHVKSVADCVVEAKESLESGQIGRASGREGV